MKQTLTALTVALALACVAPSFAAESGQPQQPQQGQAPNFEQKKADILKLMDERIKGLQEEKACVQAAKNHDDLRACREKHRAEMKDVREEMRKKRPGGPGGPGPGGPGGPVPPQGR